VENGQNGLGDEGADGGNAPRIFGLEPPLIISSSNFARFHPCVWGRYPKTLGPKRLLITQSTAAAAATLITTITIVSGQKHFGPCAVKITHFAVKNTNLYSSKTVII